MSNLKSRSQIKRVLTQSPEIVIKEIETLRAENEKLKAQRDEAIEIIEWLPRMDHWTLATGRALEAKARAFLAKLKESK